jgi:iron complex outermembrane recepter protein
VLGREAASNSAHGSGFNLRGLDAGATLVLIDGRRVAPGGSQGAFDDLSNIPLSIIDHVDILPDSASAKYGADAVGGVVNIVTRSGVSGALSQARTGGVTSGSLGEQQFSQTFGTVGDSSNGLFSFEYFRRTALLAQDRAQETNDLTAFGGSNFNSMYGSPGTIVGPNGYFAIPKGQNGTALSASSLTAGAPNLYDLQRGTDILPNQQRWSLFGKENLKLTDDVALFSEGLFTRRTVETLQAAAFPLPLAVPESNAFYVNPTGVPGPVQVLDGTTAYFGPPSADNRIDTGNFSIGFSTSDWRGWTASGLIGYTFEKQHVVQHGEVNQAALAVALADSNPATAFNPFGDGADTDPATLAAIGGDNVVDLFSTVKTFSLSAASPAVQLPGGEARVAFGAEYRIQGFDSTSLNPGESADVSDLNRRITAEFAETRIPLIGANNRLGLARKLELSFGIRHEDYSDVGSTSVPKFGVLWSPGEQMNVRGTWAKSFRPPNLSDLAEKNSSSQVISLSDPSSPSGSTSVLALFGTNPNLVPESARTWTLGADFLPLSIPGLSFSLNYFDIHYSGRIDRATLGSDVLSDPVDAWLINRTFTAAQLQAACNQTVFIGPAGGCSSSSVGAILDNRLRNISLLETSGIDLVGKYGLDTTVGKFELGFNGTYLFKYSQADTPDSALIDIVSTQNNPVNFRFRSSTSWSHRGFAVSSFVNFTNSYRDTIDVPNRGISSWTTLDLQLSYEPPGDVPEWLGRTRLALNAQNVFNTSPPFLNNPLGLGYDQENASLLGRVVSFDVTKRW